MPNRTAYDAQTPRHRGPSAIATRRTRRPIKRFQPRCDVLEGRRLLAGIAGYAEYPIPGGEQPKYIAKGSDGNLWFTETGGSDVVGMINPTTHAISQFPSPTGTDTGPRVITVGPDGNLWFTEWGAHKLGTINPATHVVTEFALPTGYVAPWGITAGPDGNLWFAASTSSSGAVGYFNPITHAFSMYNVPGSSKMLGITVGPDGNLWFTGEWADVGSINPTTHAMTEYAVPGAGTYIYAYGIAAGSDGNLWFTSSTRSDQGVGTINPATGAIVLQPTTSTPIGITSGSDGNLWIGANGQLDEINPTTDALTQFPIGADYGLATGPDGNLWFTNPTTDAIGVATLSPTQTDLVVTQQPPSGVAAGAGFGLTVAAEDGAGNVITSFDGTVTVALGSNPGGATLGGTLTATAVNGVATFSGLTLTKASSGYTLVTSAGLFGGGATASFAVTPAAPTQLVITQQPPSSVGVNGAFTVVTAIEDAYGNVVTSDDNAVTVALANNPGGATLGGTTTVSAVDGVVTFSNLTLNKKGKGYTLKLTSSGLASATSTAMTVS
jgi:virginiamycin B lyase